MTKDVSERAREVAMDSAKSLIDKASDKLNDLAAQDPIIQKLRDVCLMEEIGRTQPIDVDDDPQYYAALAGFYTKLFLNCAQQQWFWEHNISDGIMKGEVVTQGEVDSILHDIDESVQLPGQSRAA